MRRLHRLVSDMRLLNWALRAMWWVSRWRKQAQCFRQWDKLRREYKNMKGVRCPGRVTLYLGGRALFRGLGERRMEFWFLTCFTQALERTQLLLCGKSQVQENTLECISSELSAKSRWGKLPAKHRELFDR